jgi:hypothetical protein
MNRTPSKAQPLVERGAHVAVGVADIVTMLADDDAVDDGETLSIGGEPSVVQRQLPHRSEVVPQAT